MHFISVGDLNLDKFVNDRDEIELSFVRFDKSTNDLVVKMDDREVPFEIFKTVKGNHFDLSLLDKSGIKSVVLRKYRLNHYEIVAININDGSRYETVTSQETCTGCSCGVSGSSYKKKSFVM